MENKIECPKCSHETDINEAVFQALESKLRAENAEGQAKKDAEYIMKMKEADRNAYERIWKQREKQIEKVIQSTASIYGAIKGIRIARNS
jgi:hypothetical protein